MQGTDQQTRATAMNSERFREISEDSISRGYNRLPSDELLAALDPDGIHIMRFSMPHEHAGGVAVEPHVRTEWMVKLTDQTEAATVYLDMTWENFNTLPDLVKDGDSYRVEQKTVVDEGGETALDGEARENGLRGVEE